MARKPIPGEHKAASVCITIPAPTMRALEAIRQPWQTRSGQIREIVEAYLKKIQAN